MEPRAGLQFRDTFTGLRHTVVGSIDHSPVAGTVLDGYVLCDDAVASIPMNDWRACWDSRRYVEVIPWTTSIETPDGCDLCGKPIFGLVTPPIGPYFHVFRDGKETVVHLDCGRRHGIFPRGLGPPPDDESSKPSGQE